MFRTLFLLFTIACLLPATGCGSGEAADEIVAKASSAAAAGRFDEALALATRAVGVEPENVDALLFQAVLLEKRGKFDDAIAAAAKAASLAPESFPAQYTAGRLYTRNPERYSQEAQVALGKALILRPGDRNTLILLVNTQIRQHPKQAQKYLLQLGRDRQFAATAEYQNQLGICLIARASVQNAGQAFLKAFRMLPDQPVIAYNLALCMDQYRKQGRHAEPIYRRFLQLAPAGREFQDSRRFAAERIRAIR